MMKKVIEIYSSAQISSVLTLKSNSHLLIRHFLAVTYYLLTFKDLRQKRTTKSLKSWEQKDVWTAMR